MRLTILPVILLATAGMASAQAQLSEPIPGSALTATTVVFRWNHVPGATRYQLEVGNGVNRSDYASTYTANTALTVANLPNDGRTLYVRLNTQIGGTWTFRDYTFISPVVAASRMVSPAPGSTLNGPTVVFTWTPVPNASRYRIEIGNGVNRRDYASLSSSGTTLTVPRLPTDGRTLYVRLNTIFGTREDYRDYTYISGPVQASPPPGTNLRFVPVPPCRIIDTRNADGLFGGPALAGGTTRSIPVPLSPCGIPSGARAYSLNTTVVPIEPLSYLTMFPTGQQQPLVSTLNSFDGRIKANAAIVPAGTGGAISAFATNRTHLILDVNGYFIDAAVTQGLAFYPVPQCRVLDTRSLSGPTFGNPLSSGATLTVAVGLSACGIPAYARAYSLNATVYPREPLAYLTLWPAGQSQPLVSTLNAFTGTAVANAAIVPSGANGSIDAFVTHRTDLLIDINGYFAPAGYPGGLNYQTVNPCRLFDTRNPTGPSGGPAMLPGQPRSFAVNATACGVPSTATAYTVNATVVPQGELAGLTLWGAGAMPSTPALVALDGVVSANAAILAGSAGHVQAAVTHRSDVLLDINGVFIP